MLRPDATLADNPTTMPVVKSIEGVPTRTDVAFTNQAGVEKSGVRKDAEKALKNLSPVLRRMLAPEEFVVYVAGGCSPMNGVEQYTFGYFAQFVSRVTLVFTNMRLLAFRVNSKGKWTNSVRSCALGDLQSAKCSGFLMRHLKLIYANGKKESYWAMKLRDKAKLSAILPKLLEANAGKQTPAQGMQPICPTCAAALVEKLYECNGCGQRFRSEDSLWWRAFIPGAGYFYAQQSGMGVLHAIVDSIITIEFLLVIVAAFVPTPGQPPQEAWFVVGWITFLLFLERAIALSHARRFVREFIPIQGTARAAAQAASAGR
ncbi:MAG TPA: hypothetical protein VKP30_24900 [Polyangiaceae bacterium]|nr:hypothetical protein [Polyangiaceae bacterium]